MFQVTPASPENTVCASAVAVGVNCGTACAVPAARAIAEMAARAIPIRFVIRIPFPFPPDDPRPAQRAAAHGQKRKMPERPWLEGHTGTTDTR